MACSAVWVFFLTAAISTAQPLIFGRGIVNAASFEPAGLPGGSIARGSLFSVFGSGLGPATSPPLAFPLSTTLGGVSVQVSQGATTVAAIPVFVSPGQINAIMPSNAPLGNVTVRVTVNGSRGTPSPAKVTTDSFGIFGTVGPGVMQNFVDAATQPVNTDAIPAKPGQTIILYGTGLGAGLNADNVAPTAGSLPTNVEVFVGGLAAPTQYSGRSPCCSALDQLVFTVPANAPTGCWVPVQVRTNNTTVSNTVTMAISTDGSPCSEAANPLGTALRNAKKLGLVALIRANVTEDVGLPSARNVTTDTIMSTFLQEGQPPLGQFNPFFSLPPAGTCTTYNASGDLFNGDAIPGGATAGKLFNAGTEVRVTAGSTTRRAGLAAAQQRSFYPLGYTYTGSVVPSTLILNPGNVAVNLPGGADVHAFDAQAPVAAPLTWTNRDQITLVTRSQGLTVNWSGAPSGQQVVVYGGGVDLPTNASSIFVCLAASGAATLTVPSQILANIAASRSSLLQSKGAIYVGALPVSNPTSFTATGLDLGAILTGTFIGKTVIFQ